MSDYATFLASKSSVNSAGGMTEIPDLCPHLKPFQRAIVKWALRRGRAAIFAGTGLGKTLKQLAWARSVADHETARILICCPLAVAQQTCEEANKFDIPGVAYAQDQDSASSDIVVTNYERFEKFDIGKFAGVVLDESEIIKSHDGKTRTVLTEACRGMRWKLCCTATPAPNDYTELGQHAEFLEIMTAKEMLAMYFVHDGSVRADPANGSDWRLKRHAEQAFWRWLASWAVVIRSPEDSGFDGAEYRLPPLNIHQITVRATDAPAGGMLFPMAAQTLSERIGVRRDTVEARCAAAIKVINDDNRCCDTLARCETRTESMNIGAPSSRDRAEVALSASLLLETAPAVDSMSIIAIAMKQGQCEVYCAANVTSGLGNSKIKQTFSAQPRDTSWIVWCGLNSEQRSLEKYFGNRCVSVYGSLTVDEKVSRIQEFIRGDVDILLTKPSICGHGLNLQFASRMVFVGLNDSFEQLYQAIRRCWRFGQIEPVNVYLVATDLEGAVVANLRRKEADYERMLNAMSSHMRDLMRENVRGKKIEGDDYKPNKEMALPKWLAA